MKKQTVAMALIAGTLSATQVFAEQNDNMYCYKGTKVVGVFLSHGKSHIYMKGDIDPFDNTMSYAVSGETNQFERYTETKFTNDKDVKFAYQARTFLDAEPPFNRLFSDVAANGGTIKVTADFKNKKCSINEYDSKGESKKTVTMKMRYG